MPRSIDLTARSPHSVSRIRSAFENEDYWQSRLTAFEGGQPVLNDLVFDAAGSISVSITVRLGADELPDPIRRLRLPGLEIVQREQWRSNDGDDLRGDITVDALRTPISGYGVVHLTPAVSGTELMGTATVKVNVPLIGGTISRFIVGQLATGIRDIVRVTDSWLANNP